MSGLSKKEDELNKITYTREYEIQRHKKIMENISKMDICPLCKSKITEEHIGSIKDEVSPKITSFKKSN